MFRVSLAVLFALSLARTAAATDPAIPRAPSPVTPARSAGEMVFKKCAACHSVGEGAANKVGPELNGLFGRAAGSVPNYNYSEANKNSGIVWSEETFTEYIRNPRGVIKGTKMAFPGLKKDQEIADLIAYLKQFGPDGKIKVQ